MEETEDWCNAGAGGDNDDFLEDYAHVERAAGRCAFCPELFRWCFDDFGGPVACF